MNSTTQQTGLAVALAAPEILEGADTDTPEADVFSFGMVVLEVRSRAFTRRWFG